MSGVVVEPSAREAFTPRELAEAYEDFEKRGPQYLNAETGLKAATYRFGERVLIVYEESEAGVVILCTGVRRRIILRSWDTASCIVRVELGAGRRSRRRESLKAPLHLAVLDKDAPRHI